MPPGNVWKGRNRCTGNQKRQHRVLYQCLIKDKWLGYLAEQSGRRGIRGAVKRAAP